MQLQSLTIEFILLQISVAFSPGLIIALVVNEAVQKGRKNALQVAYGAAAGAVGITIITAGVITYIFSLIPEILTFIYIFGIIYIVYKGIKTIQDKSDSLKVLGSASFLSGFKINLANPKMWIFYLSVLPLFITDESNIFSSLIFLGIVTIFINLFADISYALLSSYLFNNSTTKVKRYINIISGVCLIGIGIYLFFSRFI
ncbi:MAG: LysE family translocator [Candidatus Actinomarina sp.]|nr:LysE family translocator [Candidatus Actinomarina sp.]MDA2947313.1 LysE family translocator [Actinomycetota bacterium]MBL6763043.1 LysE family translocator [Candidatus Actinomarina sp.]MBL6836319.1 LysE family translocator [Candidatus Actinomarina sp.]MDA3008389.1 LysE family translocator [Actinomycetota bacterium]